MKIINDDSIKYDDDNLPTSSVPVDVKNVVQPHISTTNGIDSSPNKMKRKATDFHITTILRLTSSPSLDEKTAVLPNLRLTTPNYHFPYDVPYSTHISTPCFYPFTYHTGNPQCLIQRRVNHNLVSKSASDNDIQEVSVRVTSRGRDNSRRSRPTFDTRQIDELEMVFQRNMYVYGMERAKLANRLEMTEKQVKIWFQNRRSKHKRESLLS